MKLLYFGTLAEGTTSLQRLEALHRLAGHLYAVDQRLFIGDYPTRTLWVRIQLRAGLAFLPLFAQTGAALAREVRRYRPEVVWVDGGYCLSLQALRRIKEDSGAVLVHYTPDSLKAPGWYSFMRSLPEYDLVITTKPQDLEIYRTHGAKQVLLSHLGYDPRLHRPLNLGPEEMERFACDVAFVGVRMEHRAQSLCRLVREVPCRLHLYGRGWDEGATGKYLAPLARGWVHGDDYAKALSGAKICLAFLNRKVGDTYTTRSLEIPACGAFMLAERTPVHLELFEEDREAAYFESDAELVDKVKYYLKHDQLRQRIAEAGHAKLRRLGFTWEDHLKTCLQTVNRVVAEQRSKGKDS